ncbi:MAG: hypothetical protein V4628_15835 [Pseudomonadota bacterium]
MKIGRINFLLVLCLLSFGSKAQSENPSYNAATSQLIVPSADSVTQPGIYQDNVFEFLPNGYWRLVSNNTGAKIRWIDHVELIKTATFPVQIFLKVSGTFRSGCERLGKISQRRVNNTFEVFLYYRPMVTHEPVACTANVTLFSEVVPLSVYDLVAGDYAYTVNGSLNGTFNLASDNSL